jgi:hypothetical protein
MPFRQVVPMAKSTKMRSRTLIKDGEMICQRGSFLPQAIFSNICMVSRVERMMTHTVVHVVNCQGLSASIQQPNDVDLHPHWFRLCHEGKLLAPYEAQVTTYILSNPGCTLDQISFHLPCRQGLNGVRSAITRIAKKGFTMINNYIRV